MNLSTPPSGSNFTALYDRVLQWMARVRFSRKFGFLVIALAILAGGATYLVFSQSELLEKTPVMAARMLYIDLIILLLLGVLIAKRLVKLWAERRSRRAGSKLHVHLVMVFSLLTVTPAIVVTILSGLFFNAGVQSWFNERVSTALSESNAVAQAYLEEHKKVITGTIDAMAKDIAHQFHELASRPEIFNNALDAYSEVRALDEAIVFDASQVLARSRLSFSLQFERFDDEYLEKARKGIVIIPSERGDRVRALVQIAPSIQAFLLVGRFIDPNVQKRIQQVSGAVSEYHQLESLREELELKFALIFIVICLLMLLIAIWVGLFFALRLARPISDLIEAAERVREGDLSVRVLENYQEHEVSVLGRAFNRMTTQLEQQRDDLVEANRQIDLRRQFIEDVLAGVSSGVVGLSAAGEIRLCNRSAAEMLTEDPKRVVGKKLADVVPEMGKFVAKMQRTSETFTQSQVVLNRKGLARVLLVRVVVEQRGKKLEGFIVTFDDVTDLVNAQRKAAWSDVARRIAHEIKNPLTPIQLSAERLRRKYGDRLGEDPQTFEMCIDTIIRQVDHIGRMVQEFSGFARMPAPKMQAENILKIAQEAVFLQQSAHPGIVFEMKQPSQGIGFSCDASQITQVLTNLLQNGIDAIKDFEKKGAPGNYKPKIKIIFDFDENNFMMTVEDNGKGFPKEDRERLTEPYVTKKEKGTGLGLAIAQKIVEDHGGTMGLEDRKPRGARVRLVFPASLIKLMDKGGKNNANP